MSIIMNGLANRLPALPRRYCAGCAPTWSSATASDPRLQEELLAALEGLLDAAAGQ
jgi:hypothetical protein